MSWHDNTGHATLCVLGAEGGRHALLCAVRLAQVMAVRGFGGSASQRRLQLPRQTSHGPPPTPPPAGRYARNNCPAYLTPHGFANLKQGALDSLQIHTGFFLPTLNKRKYSKVILMDHVDWLSFPQAEVGGLLRW